MARSVPEVGLALRLLLVVGLKVLVDDGHSQQDACAQSVQPSALESPFKHTINGCTPRFIDGSKAVGEL